MSNKFNSELIPPGYQACPECGGSGIEKESFGDYGAACSRCNESGFIPLQITRPSVSTIKAGATRYAVRA